MIMPAKHINFSESLLGFGSYILQNLDEPKSVDEFGKSISKICKMDFILQNTVLIT